MRGCDLGNDCRAVLGLQRHLIARHGGDLLFAEDAPGLTLDHTLFGLDVVKAANSFYDISLHPFLPQDSSALHQSPRPVPSLLEESPLLEELPPIRPLHQSLEELPGCSAGVSGTGSGPALTVMLTRLFTLTVDPAAGLWPMMVPGGLVAVLLGGAAKTQLVLHQHGAGIVHTLEAGQAGTLAVVLTCGRLT